MYSLSNRYFIAGNIWLVLALVLLIGPTWRARLPRCTRFSRWARGLPGDIQSARRGGGRAGDPDALVEPERGEGIAGAPWKRRVIL